VTPTVLAGHTMEPQVSLPRAKGSNPAASIRHRAMLVTMGAMPAPHYSDTLQHMRLVSHASCVGVLCAIAHLQEPQAQDFILPVPKPALVIGT
jgi:uncharacterized NAD-dependent epimerase/dehydratase family protein